MYIKRRMNIEQICRLHEVPKTVIDTLLVFCRVTQVYWLGPMIGGCLAAKLYKDSFLACKLAPPLHRSVRALRPEEPEVTSLPPEKRVLLDDVDSKPNDSKLSDMEKSTAI